MGNYLLSQKFIVNIEEFRTQPDVLEDKNSIELNKGINLKLCDVLMSYKNMITHYYNNKTWDKFKKMANEYEYVYSSPSCAYNVSNYTPVSRSFFKMWEILHDFNGKLFQQPEVGKGIKCVFLCEGPGGFAEAVMKFRSNPDDEYYGITLKCDNNKMVPDWKLQTSKLNITYGIDGTGDIYNVENIKFLTTLIGKRNNADFITGDGGFDFSADFNNQEDMCFKLLASEILAALYLQKPGGTFVLKLFDIFHDKTIKLMHVLHTVYDNIYITKPFTSRPANSEKYIVCVNFKNIVKLSKLRDQLEACIKSDDHTKIQIATNIEVLQKIVYFNTFMVMKQIHYIQKTIDMIKSPPSLHIPIEKHADVCKKWCVDYKL